MLKLAICDNDEKHMSYIENLIIQNIPSVKIEKKTFPEQIIDLVSKGSFFDIILTETAFKYTTGIEFAKSVRKYDKRSKIIFISNNANYCVDSYTVDAYSYILKPIDDVYFLSLLKKCIEETENSEFVCLPIKYGAVRRKAAEIEYISIYKKCIEYYFTDGTVEEYMGYLNSVEERVLKFPCFYKALRSIIINMDHVKKVKCGEISMNSGFIFSVNKNKSKEVSKHILNWINSN